MVTRLEWLSLLACISCIYLDVCLCNHDGQDHLLELPVSCNEGDYLVWEHSECWKCECFNNETWGCFQGMNENCTNLAPPRLPTFPDCPQICGPLDPECRSRPVGSVWIKDTPFDVELCWCDGDGQDQCYPEQSLIRGDTIADYRNMNVTCIHDDVLQLNIGDSVISECSICVCFNGTLLCAFSEDCEGTGPPPPVELQCPLDVASECFLETRPFCTDDSDCPEMSKCCKVNCVMQCVPGVPSATKPGACPGLAVSTTGLTTPCTTDYDCDAHLKCCYFVRSSYQCSEPYDPYDCQSGEPIRPCFFENPCESTRCPNHPHAFCRINHCGLCHAQYFVNNERVNCYNDTVCEITTPIQHCFLDPLNCQSALSCPNSPDATCRINYCGSCFYEYFNEQDEKVACFDGPPCPLGVEELACDYTCSIGQFTCVEADPEANLTCVPKKCDRCSFPTYLYDNGTEAECFNLEGNCPNGTEPPRVCVDHCTEPIFECTNPDVVTCKLNYCHGKCVPEHYDAMGQQVSCFGGLLCPPGQEEASPEESCFTKCSDAACPAYPNATCVQTACNFQCREVFLDPVSGDTVNCSEGHVCPEDAPVNPLCLPSFVVTDFIFFTGCTFAACPLNEDAKCFVSPCGTCHAEYYIGSERVNCFGAIPCAPGIQEHRCSPETCDNVHCPAFPSAVCIINACGGCNPQFQLPDGTLVDDCFAGIQCPMGEVNALCPADICQIATCEAHPEAECVISHCETCRAQFFYPNGTHVDDCSSVHCREGDSEVTCGDVCEGAVCRNFPDATCHVNNCGLCSREYVLSNGTILAAEDCGGNVDGFCPLFISSRALRCESDSNCNPSQKCCPNEFGSFCAEPEEVDPSTCVFESTVYLAGQLRIEECQYCVCQFGEWICFPTKCNLTCTPEAPYFPGCQRYHCLPLDSDCPAYPESRCTVNPCGGCTVEFVDQESNEVVDCYDPAQLDCPAEEPVASCEFNPCLGFCPSYPSANCKIEPCGICTARYEVGGNEVNCFEEPYCYENGVRFQGEYEFRLSDNSCTLCICLSSNFSVCVPESGCAVVNHPCIENEVEYPPLYSRRQNCTECVCSAETAGEFYCASIPGCDDFQKSGVCPPRVSPSIVCEVEVVHQCDHDEECPGDEKCCHESCGSVCVPPSPEGFKCFSCSSFVSPDFSYTEDTCSDVTLPTVTSEKCLAGVPCISVTAKATFSYDATEENSRSVTLYQRGCGLVSDQNSTGCFFGDCASQPEICLEVETWVNTHEGRAPIIDFRTSTCVCEGNECNHVIPPDIPTSTMPSTSTASIQTTPTGTTLTLPSTTVSTTTTMPITTPGVKQTTTIGATSTLSTTAVPTTRTIPVTTNTAKQTTSAGATSTSSSTTVPTTTTAPITTSAAKYTSSSGVVSTLSTSTDTGTTNQRGTTATTAVPKTMTAPPTTQTQSAAPETTAKRCSSDQVEVFNDCTTCSCQNNLLVCRFDDNCNSDGEPTVNVQEVKFKLTGNYQDVSGHEDEFSRALIAVLVSQSDLLDVPVFVNTELSAGSIVVTKNVTDGRATALEIADTIKMQVESGSFSFEFQGRSYTALESSFEYGQSYSFRSPVTDTPSTDGSHTILIVVIVILVTVTCVIVIVLAVRSFRRRGKYGVDSTMLIRLSRNPSMVSQASGRVEFENPVYS